MNPNSTYLKILLYFFIVTLIVQLGTSYFTIGHLDLTLLGLIRKASLSVTITMAFHLAFIKWIWKWKILHPWLVPFPNLSGTWEGSIESSWKGNDGKGEAYSSELTAFITQSFTEISVEIHTNLMSSNSYMAGFIFDPNSGSPVLCYSYMSRSTVPSRPNNPWHDGTTRLSIFNGKELRLQGEYWTTRQTTGEIVLRRASKLLLVDSVHSGLITGS